MTVALSPVPFFRSWDNNGNPLVGGLLYTYVAGTSTPQATYVDSTETTQNTNPVVLNFRGEASVWLNAALTYKLVLTDSVGNQIWSQDQISVPALSQATIGALLYPQTAAEIAAGVTPTSYQYPPYNVFRYMTAAQIADWQNGGGVYDHGPFIQSAINTLGPVYMPQGSPQVRTQINCPNSGQSISGASMLQTVLTIPSGFNLSAPGIFNVTAAEPSVELSEFTMAFTQPNTSIYSNLIAYPPAVFMQASPRAMLRRLKITNAKTCIDARLNSGGSYFEDLQLSHFDYGIRIDGSEDTMRVLACHFFPFSVANTSLYYASTNVGVSSGRCDDLVIESCLFLCGQGVSFYTGSESGLAGVTFGTITNTDFDTYNGIQMSAGTIQCSACDLDTTTGNYSIYHTGGELSINNSLFVAAAGSTSVLSNNQSGANASFSITDSIFQGSIGTAVSIIGLSTTSGNTDCTISDNRFTYLPQNTNQTQPVISVQSSARLTFMGNTANDKGSGNGNLLQISSDGYHVVQGNNFLGWGISLPIAPTMLSFSGNIGSGYLATNTGTSAFAASTTVIVTHGVNAFGVAPNADQIIITPTSAQPTGGYYVSATSSTTFTLTAATSTSMTFGWQVTNRTAT